MKKLTCKDLGGVCNAVISGDSFAEMGKNARAHGIAMCNNGDASHLLARDKMEKATDEQQAAWMVEFQKKFNDAPNA